MRRLVVAVVAIVATVLLSPVSASAGITGMRVSLTAIQPTPTSPPTLTGLVELQRDGVWGSIGSSPQVTVNLRGRPTAYPEGPTTAYPSTSATPNTGTITLTPGIQQTTEFYVTTYYGGPATKATSETVVLEPAITEPPNVTSGLRISATANPATIASPPTLTGLVEYKKNGVWQPVPTPFLMVRGRPVGDPNGVWSLYGNVVSYADGTYLWGSSVLGQQTLEFYLVAGYDGHVAWSERVELELTG